MAMADEQNMELVRQRLTDEFALAQHKDKGDFVNHLALRINMLILEDFPMLVSILYRLDVDETHLREILAKYIHDDAGYIIAQLIIERQLKKVESRKNYKRDENIPDEDKW
jgi:hypothetical protein